MARHAFALALVSVLILGAVACDQETDQQRDVRGRGDGPVGRVHDEPSEVFNFPDHYSNVATQCDGHGHRMYTGTRNEDAAPVIVVIDDPTCSGGGE